MDLCSHLPNVDYSSKGCKRGPVTSGGDNSVTRKWKYAMATDLGVCVQVSRRLGRHQIMGAEQTPGYGAGQTPSYGAGQTSGYGAEQTPGYVAGASKKQI